MCRLHIAARSRCSNALAGYGHSQMGGVRETRAVPAVALDDLARMFSKPDVVKVDVEGAEGDVLAGATTVLSQCRPIVVIEVGKDAAKSTATALSAFDYRFFDGDAPLPLAEETELPHWNCYAIPGERLQEIRAIVGQPGP